MRYERLSLHLGMAPEGAYVVSVRSAQGEGKGRLRLPLDLELRPPSLAPTSEALVLGKELFRQLFRGEPGNLYHAARGSLEECGAGLRIEITIDPRRPELARLQALPWELLCRPETEDFLALSRGSPVVRSLDAHRERRFAPPRPRRLRILAVAASPKECPPLDVERELANLEAAWKGQERRVEIVPLRRGGLDEIRAAFLAKPFHILHFMGHGHFDSKLGEGVLYFERPDGSRQVLDGRRLAQLLRDFRALRLVVLNACQSASSVGAQGSSPFAGAASSLVMGGVPAVVAMSGPVSDPAAVAFSRELYLRLAAGDPIEAAVTEGRLAILRSESFDGEWATPALFLRSSEGRLFAPPSTVWARRLASGAGAVAALAAIASLGLGWERERRGAEASRRSGEGVGLLQLGRPEEARTSLRSALDARDDSAEALGNLAVVEQRLGEDEAALRHAEAAVRAAPGEAVHRYNLGHLLATRKRSEEALASLGRAVELDPAYAVAYNELGNVYLDLERPADARAALETGLRWEPHLAVLHKNLARVDLAEGAVGAAVRRLRKAIPLYLSSDPAGRAEATYWLATALFRQGRRAEACAALGELRILDPVSLGWWTDRVRRLAKEGACPR